MKKLVIQEHQPQFENPVLRSLIQEIRYKSNGNNLSNFLINQIRNPNYMNSRGVWDLMTTIAEKPLSKGFNVFTYDLEIDEKNHEENLRMLQNGIDINKGIPPFELVRNYENLENYKKFIYGQSIVANANRPFVEISPSPFRNPNLSLEDLKDIDSRGSYSADKAMICIYYPPDPDTKKAKVLQLWFQDFEIDEWSSVLSALKPDADSQNCQTALARSDMKINIARDTEVMQQSGFATEKQMENLLSILQKKRGIHIDQNAIKHVEEIKEDLEYQVRNTFTKLIDEATYTILDTKKGGINENILNYYLKTLENNLLAKQIDLMDLLNRKFGFQFNEIDRIREITGNYNLLNEVERFRVISDARVNLEACGVNRESYQGVRGLNYLPYSKNLGLGHSFLGKILYGSDLECDNPQCINKRKTEQLSDPTKGLVINGDESTYYSGCPFCGRNTRC